jgi:hypothetical protein
MTLLNSSKICYLLSGNTGKPNPKVPYVCIHKCSDSTFIIRAQSSSFWNAKLKSTMDTKGCNDSYCQCTDLISQLSSVSEAKKQLLQICQQKNKKASIPSFNSGGLKKKKKQSLVTLEFDVEEESELENADLDFE